MELPKLSAHRGGPEDEYPPNGLAAIRAALDVGVDMIEFDVRTTSDGKFVTHHDAQVSQGGGEGRQIAQLTESEVFAAAPDAAPLSDVLALIKGKALGHVDLKDTCLEVEIADICERALGPDGFVLTTLEDISVRRLRIGRPHLRVALSLGRSTAGLSRLATARLRLSEIFPQRRLRRCDPNMLALNHKIAKLGVLALARRRGLPVLLWTINDPEMIASVAFDSRYWGFTTDFPRLVNRLR